MTLYSVIFRPRAEEQLDRLFTYIASHGGESRANSFVLLDASLKHAYRLQPFPNAASSAIPFAQAFAR
jgi:plasmid stabilization system protein ParE